MTTLFNIEQYQNFDRRDWDGVIYDPAWDKLADDESVEPPIPVKDFESNPEHEEAWQQWQTENSDSLTCAVEWERDLLWPDCSLEDSSLSDSQKSTSIAAIASQNSTQESTITEMLMPLRENGSLKEESIYSVAHHPVNPSQFRENDLLLTTSETVFPQSLESLEAINQNTSASKTLEDCSTVPTPQEAIAHISDTSLKSFTAAGTMQNGYVYLAEPLPAPSIEEDYCWLPAPTALSTRGSRPPGLNKLETFLKKNELINKGEVLNPVILSEWFGIPSTWLDPSESRTAAELLENNAAPPETFLTPESPRSPSSEYSTSIHSAPVKEPASEYSTTLKAISLWQPWASLIPLGLKHYETRSWKTNYRGKLLICSTAANSKQHKEYLKICNELQLPPWENFLHGCAIALCNLVDCIEMTPEFIAQQSQTELLCGDWQVGRYAWKLENIQPITELFAVKGKQGLFNISLDIIQSQRQLVELLGDEDENSPSKITSPSTNSPSNLLEDERDNSPSKITSLSTNSPSNLLEDERDNSPSKKRLWGEGNGYIYWRTITKNDKEYPQAYYHWKEGNKKRSKYILKKLLGVVEEAEAAKHPVIEILKLLGVELDSRELLGDTENSPSNSDANADISKSADKLLGDKWINNGENNISQGIEHSPSNLDNSPSKIEFSPSKQRKGDGSGSIHWRTITRGGKDYPQAYYHYEIWSGGDRLVKSSKYIPKRLLPQVQRLEVEKVPVKEILQLLGINL